MSELDSATIQKLYVPTAILVISGIIITGEVPEASSVMDAPLNYDKGDVPFSVIEYVRAGVGTRTDEIARTYSSCWA